MYTYTTGLETLFEMDYIMYTEWSGDGQNLIDEMADSLKCYAGGVSASFRVKGQRKWISKYFFLDIIIFVLYLLQTNGFLLQRPTSTYIPMFPGSFFFNRFHI